MKLSTQERLTLLAIAKGDMPFKSSNGELTQLAVRAPKDGTTYYRRVQLSTLKALERKNLIYRTGSEFAEYRLTIFADGFVKRAVTGIDFFALERDSKKT